MKRIIVFDGRPAQGRPRGMGIYALRLLPALLGAHPEFQLMVALDRRAGADPWPELNQPERLWGAAGNPIAWEQKVLPALAKTAGAHLLHCTANASPLASTVPHIVTVYDAMFMRGIFQFSDQLHFKQIAAYLYYRWMVKAGAHKARRVLTISDYSKKEIIKKLHVNPEKIHVGYLGSPSSAPALPENRLHEILLAYGINRPYVLGLGAIDRRKNIANLVRAFARLPRSAVENLVLAGFEKTERSLVPTLIKNLKIKDRVRILGYVPEQDLTALFQGAAVFAYPSLEEGFGLPILLAFHLGVPVITARSGAIPEVAGEAVRYVDPQDPRHISQEILEMLIDSDAAHHTALAGYMRAKMFTWESTAQTALAAYEKVLKEL